MDTKSVVIVGAGPAGLSAAIEAASAGADCLVIDENTKPGGQLFKQIHKFFGSRHHQAGVRGFDIGANLLEQTKKLGIQVWLNSVACGLTPEKKLWVVRDGKRAVEVNARCVILATGAIENTVNFPGWTLPGVMGAGAAQTMINLHRVLPGNRVLMVGSGNVGVIVSYQLMQAGADVVAVVEGAPQLGGYGVHTAKVRRAGVPFYTSYTVLRAEGRDRVEGAVIVKLDEKWAPVPGTEKRLDVDTICIAAGLTPLAELAWMAGCGFAYIPELGGHIPVHDRNMQTTIPGIYVAGDISGVEEASTAMEEGRLAGLAAAASLGLVAPEQTRARTIELWNRLDSLRMGPYGDKRRIAKQRLLETQKEEIASWKKFA